MKNLSGLMKQASQMQEKMQEMQARIEATVVEGQSGAGMVRLTLSGKGDLKSVVIDPKLIDPNEIEMLADLIVAAHADAKRTHRCRDARRNGEGYRRIATAARHEAAILNAKRWS